MLFPIFCRSICDFPCKTTRIVSGTVREDGRDGNAADLPQRRQGHGAERPARTRDVVSVRTRQSSLCMGYPILSDNVWDSAYKLTRFRA